MNIITLNEKQLTDAELATVQHFAALTNKDCFAYLGEQVFVLLPSAAEEYLNDLIQLTRERMADISPASDYSRFGMPDGSIMVGLPGGVCALSPDGCEGDPSSILLLRHMCIDACRENNIAAIIFNHD